MTKVAASEVLQRIRAEYLEMPGLSLKAEQVQRLCGVDRVLCQKALEALVETGFLSMRPDGAYGRFGNADVSRTRPATASLEPRASALRSRIHKQAS